MPPPPPIAQPPVLWGDEEHVRELFAESGIGLEFRRETVERAQFDSTDQAIEYLSTRFGPMIMARAEKSVGWPAIFQSGPSIEGETTEICARA